MSPGTPTTMLRLALAGLLASAPCALWAGEVTGISVNQGSTGTRAEIQLAGAGQYKTLSLHGPGAVDIDGLVHGPIISHVPSFVVAL